MWFVHYKTKADEDWTTFISTSDFMNVAVQEFATHWFKRKNRTAPKAKDFHQARRVMWDEGIDFYISKRKEDYFDCF